MLDNRRRSDTPTSSDDVVRPQREIIIENTSMKQAAAKQTNSNPKDDNQPSTNQQRRSADPRERLRKEQDGIVLSPQRRSFNSGCFVNVTEPPPSKRSVSPVIGKTEVFMKILFTGFFTCA